MRIVPIAQTPISIYKNTTTNNNNKNTKIPSFNSYPLLSFRGNEDNNNSIIETQLEMLKSNIQEILTEDSQKNKEKYIQLGKIGYDSQEKLKIIKKYEKTLFNKKFNALNQNTLQQIIPNALLYEKYLTNIKDFERLTEIVNNNPNYATSEIINAINKGKIKIHRDDKEFQKLKPAYLKIQEVQTKLKQDLDKINSKNNPLFSQKIQDLDEQNKIAAMLILISGTIETSDIIKEYEQIKKDYQNRSQSTYSLIKRIDTLNRKIDHFKFENSNTTDYTTDIDQFLRKNKNYKEENISEQEIHQTYQKLLTQTDNIITQYTQELEQYTQTNPIKLSPRILDRTFKSQDKINKQIQQLIYNEKIKIYKNN